MRYFICMAGLDGAGKTTQCKLLTEYLQKENPIYYTFGSIRDNTRVNRAVIEFYKKTDLSLNSSQKYLIKSAFHMYDDLKKLSSDEYFSDKIVIMDRYVETMYAHAQLYGVDSDIIQDIFKDVYIEPDYYFFLNVKPEVCYKRIVERGGVSGEHEELESLNKLYQAYQEIIPSLGMRVIDANDDFLATHRNIVEYIQSKL